MHKWLALAAIPLGIQISWGASIPEISRVLNAASYALDGLPNAGIAQGSMFTIFGQNLGPGTLQQASLPLPRSLAGTSVRVTVGGTANDAILVYSYSTQVAAVLPSATPTGDGTLTVTYQGQVSDAAPIHVVGSAFGILTRNSAGSGPAIIQNWSPTAAPPNTLTQAARPGQLMVLWGTGLGPVSFDETVAPQAANLSVAVDVLVGNQTATVLYKGRSPEFPGLDQINFQLPGQAALGCYVPVAVRAAGVTSNFVTISISPNGGTCSDSMGFRAADLEIAQNVGQFRIGSFAIGRLGSAAVGMRDAAEVSVQSYDPLTLLQVLGVADAPRAFETGQPPYGTCVVRTGVVDPTNPLSFPHDPVHPTDLSDGPGILTLKGPQGTKTLLASGGTNLGGGITGWTPNYGPAFLLPGVYTLDNSTGSTAVGPFRATLTLPTPLNWTNADTISSVPRTQDLTVTWSGGDPGKEYTIITGISASGGSEGVLGAFLCTERADAGQFTIPSVVLSSLPASGSLGTPTGPAGFLEVGSSSIPEASRFQAQGLDAAYFMYEMSNVKLVGYQ